MRIELNHTIVAARNRWSAARFTAEVLGLPEPVRFGPFAVVALDNAVNLDFMDVAEVPSQHYAFLIGEDDFDAVAARLAERGVPTFADPAHHEAGHNTHDGGRGMYFDSPDGHNLEVITRPYGAETAAS